MSDRAKGLVVTLDRDMTEDEWMPIANAIRQVRGVLVVEPNEADFEDQMNRDRVKFELRKKLWDVLK